MIFPKEKESSPERKAMWAARFAAEKAEEEKAEAVYDAELERLEKAAGLGEWLKAQKVNLWKPKMRLYISFELVAEIIGLEYALYKSGYVSSATLDGESISNNRATRIARLFDRLYIDSCDVTSRQDVIEKIKSIDF